MLRIHIWYIVDKRYKFKKKNCVCAEDVASTYLAQQRVWRLPILGLHGRGWILQRYLLLVCAQPAEREYSAQL